MKKMKNKTTILSTILCLLPIVLSVVLYDQLPEQVAVHFNDAGTPDGFLPRAAAAFGLPIALALINLYTHFRIYNDPKAEKAALSVRSLGKWLAPLLSVVMVPITLFIAIGRSIPVTMIGSALAGLMILICGNYLPKCRRNYTIGIKLPWTLASEDTWFHTHRVAGIVWVLAGIILVINAFLRVPYILLITIICLVIIPFLYSYLFYQSHTDAEPKH